MHCLPIRAKIGLEKIDTRDAPRSLPSAVIMQPLTSALS